MTIRAGTPATEPDCEERTPRLGRAALAALPAAVARPRFDPRAHATGIVHIGGGAFHRAHQAVYTDDVLGTHGGDWAIAAVSLRSPTIRDALLPQDGLYALSVRDHNVEQLRVIGAIRDVIVAPESPARVLELLARPSVHVVTLTITEKGYCLDPASAELDTAHADIRHDLAHPLQPVSAIGYLAAAILRRRAHGAPLTVISCDNLAANGAKLEAAVHAFLENGERGARAWCERLVRFPSTVVDRIVPATTATVRDAIAQGLGVRDEACVQTEAFSQWIIEDAFAGPRPPWESVGAQFVNDVAPYEIMKLRLLNGAHSAIAYLGSLGGFEFVHETMRDPVFAAFVEQLMEHEIAPEVQAPPGFALAAYSAALRRRFANAALGHRTAQIAMDGSQKLPQRLLPVIRSRLAAGRELRCLATVVAAWIKYVSGRDLAGGTIEVADPLASRLAVIAGAARGPDELVRALLAVFGEGLAESPLAALAADALRTMERGGIAAAMRACLPGEPEGAA